MNNDTHNGYVVWVDFRIKAGFESAFLKRVEQQAKDSLAGEPQCLVFDVCTDPDAPDRVILYEVYVSAEAFQFHRTTDYFKAFSADIETWVASKQVQQLTRR